MNKLRIIIFVLICLMGSYGIAGDYCGPMGCPQNGSMNVCPKCGRVHQSPQSMDSMVPDYESKQHPQIVLVKVPEANQGMSSAGTGFVIGATEDTGYILTAWHTFRDWDRRTIPYIETCGRRFDATVVDLNQGNDLALLRVRGTGFKPILIADQVPTGETTIHGYGFRGGGSLRRIFGRFSRVFRTKNGLDLIEVRCGIPMGFSGGPFLNSEGKIVGVMVETDGQIGLGPTCIVIRRLYAKYILVNPPQQDLPPVPGVDPPIDEPDPVEPGCDCNQGGRLDAIEKRLKTLENIKITEQITIINNKIEQIEQNSTNCDQVVDERLIPINSKLDHLQEKVTALETKVDSIDQDALVEQVYQKISTDLNSLQENINNKFEQIENKITQIQPSEIDYDRIVTEVVNRLGGGSADEGDVRARLLYFTVDGLERCDETDALANKVWESGYPINIITLTPQDTSVSDVPRLFNTKTNEDIRGKSNIITYFSSLTL